MSELDWGRRYLLCPPAHFEVVYEINPWMTTTVRADPERARQQFDSLVRVLERAGAAIELLEPVEGLPDLVFTANAGVLSGSVFVPARFRHPERQGETPRNEAWFRSHGYRIEQLPPGMVQEGAGDALPFRAAGGMEAVLLCGYRTRSDAAAHVELSRRLGVASRSVELVDQRFYHLDLVFCPLDDRRALIAPMGLDRYGIAVVEALVPEPIWLEEEEAAAFVANSVVVGSTVVMPSCPVRVGRLLERSGFAVEVCPMGEFLKAGGGCRCLTLALDVDLGSRVG